MAFGAFILIFLAFSIAGAYPTYRLLDSKHRRYLVIITPHIGVALTLTLIGIFHHFGLNSKEGSTLSFAYLFLLSIINSKKIFKELKKLKWKSDFDIFAALIFAICCGFILVKPLLDRHLLTWFGGGSDSLGYINGASYLLKHSYPQDYLLDKLDEFQPWKGWIFHIIHFDFLGNFFNLSAISNLLRIDPVKIFNPLMAIYGSLTILGVFLLARIGFELSEKISLICCGLLTLHTYWMMPHYTTFLNQAAGLAFTTTSLAFIPKQLTLEGSKKEAIIFGLLTGSLIAFYSIFISFIILSSIFFVFLSYKSIRFNMKSLSLRLFLVFLACVIVNNFYFIQNFTRGFAVGTDALFSPLSYFQNWPHFITFFTNYTPPHYNWGQINQISQIKNITLALGSILIFCRAFISLKSAHRSFFISLVASCLLLSITAYFKGNGYGLWKILTFTNIIYVIGFSMGTIGIWKKYNEYSKKPKLMVSCLLFIIIVSHFHSARILTLNPFYELPKGIEELTHWIPLIKKELKDNEALKIEIQEPYSIYEWLSVLYTIRELPLYVSPNARIHKELFYGDYQKRYEINTPLALLKIDDKNKNFQCILKNADYCIIKLQ